MSSVSQKPVKTFEINETSITSNTIIKRKHNSSKDEKVVSVKTSNKYFQSVPSSFAILVNFGIDGRRRMLFSSNTDDHHCGDQHIWDPFNEQCRQMYCSAHFTLVDFKCVENNAVNNVVNQTNATEQSVSFLDSNSDSVNITIGFNLSKPVSDICDWIETQNESFQTQFITQFSTSFGILTKSQRITNVTYSCSQYSNNNNSKFISQNNNILFVNFLLKEDSIRSDKTNNDAILVVLSSEVSQRQLSFNLFNNVVNGFSIHTTISQIKWFCNKNTEISIWYRNSQFYLETENNMTFLYVNETGRRYKPGQYLGNILYVQNIQTSEDLEANKVNVSSNAVVCETQTLIDENCPRILLNRTEFEWKESSESGKVILVEVKSNQTHTHFELAPDGVFVCVTHETQQTIQDIVEDILSTVLIIISIIALTCVLITYLMFESLRSTINGFNTINLSLCIELMQILFLTSPHLFDCKVGAVILHFVLLLTMSWSSVIAYDMYRTFVLRRFRTRHNNICKLRLIYCLWAYFCAAFVLIVSIICERVDSVVNPDYGDLGDSNGCWIRNPSATFLFFGVPLIINILVNLIFYLMTICQVRCDLKTWNSLRKVTRIPSDSSNTSSGTGRSVSTSSNTSLTLNSRPNSMLIFTRLGVLMGFTWIIALIIAVIPQTFEIPLKVLSYLFVILNTSQGVVIFIAFVCNTRVIKLWKNLLKV